MGKVSPEKGGDRRLPVLRGLHGVCWGNQVFGYDSVVQDRPFDLVSTLHETGPATQKLQVSLMKRVN